jgi:hypothetical protein
LFMLSPSLWTFSLFYHFLSLLFPSVQKISAHPRGHARAPTLYEARH